MNRYTIIRASLLGLVLGVPPPALSAEFEAPWDESPAPFVFSGDPVWVDQDRAVRRSIKIQSPAGLNVGEGVTLRLDGPVHSDGPAVAGLYKLGAGRMTLSGPNTYRGNTWLLQGSLHLAHSEALGSDINGLDANVGTRLEYADGITVAHDLTVSPIDLGMRLPADWWVPVMPTMDPDAVQWVVEQGEAAFSGTLFGNVPIIKRGQGTLRFAGRGLIYGGDMTVREGTLRLDSTLAGLTRIESGARLEGVGTLGAAWIGGTLSPGGRGIGTLSVQRNLDFAAGSQTHIQVAADGSGDLIKVGGVATLAGHVAVEALPGDWQTSTQYTIVQAVKGLAGSRYDSVAGNLPYLSPALSYEADRVLLTMLRNDTALEAHATTPDARDAGRVIDHDVQALEDRVARQSYRDADRTLSTLAHAGAASLRSAMIEDTRYVRQAARAHAGSGRSWTQSWLANASRDAGMGDRGLLWADSRDTSGLLVGIDQAIAPDWYLGGFAGMQHMDFATQGSPYGVGAGSFRARSISLHAGATLVTGGEDWSLSLGLTHGQHRSRSLRDIGRLPGFDTARLRATQQARSTQAWLAWQARQPLAPHWRIQPWAQLAWVRLDSQDYAEDGGLAALRVQGAVDQRVLSTLGIQATRLLDAPMGAARVQARLGWQAMLGATDLVSTQSFGAGQAGQTFEAGGQPLARHALQLQIGVDAPIAPGIWLGLGYTGQFQRGGPQHGVVLNIGVGW
ncbi:autotransporter domain-containing protein [Alcaligenaceae bacterium CGII-47]|nr:autotransporter domain-containing protein [Alcaligenaceae bacterium CGII-47]